MEGKEIGSEHVKRHSESGLSISEYCRQNGIAANSFYNWKSKAKKQSGFVKVSPGTDRIELELSNGVRIKVAEDQLSTVLGALSAS